MGYHFDYNVVDYKAKQYFGFPQDLACLTKTVARLFQFENYIAETGIINYYPEGSSMGGHTDHYEEALAQPLISYSFGQSAIYLIGGQTRDVKPAGICLTIITLQQWNSFWKWDSLPWWLIISKLSITIKSDESDLACGATIDGMTWRKFWLEIFMIREIWSHN